MILNPEKGSVYVDENWLLLEKDVFLKVIKDSRLVSEETIIKRLQKFSEKSTIEKDSTKPVLIKYRSKIIDDLDMIEKSYLYDDTPQATLQMLIAALKFHFKDEEKI